LRLQLHPGQGYLLGYPLNTTLGYDPTPGPEWRSLLTLCSDDELEWCWHDGDWLVTFIEEQRLRAGDFSQVKSDAGWGLRRTPIRLSESSDNTPPALER